jgi:hypothetical protein
MAVWGGGGFLPHTAVEERKELEPTWVRFDETSTEIQVP